MTKTIGYIACDPTISDFTSDHEGTIQPTWERAHEDCGRDNLVVRVVGSDGYLYVEEPESAE